MLHICISELDQYWFRYWLVAYLAPSHYLNQCWVIVNWTLRNKHQWNLNQNTNIFIHKNASEKIVCETAAILSKGRWVNRTDEVNKFIHHKHNISKFSTDQIPQGWFRWGYRHKYFLITWKTDMYIHIYVNIVMIIVIQDFLKHFMIWIRSYSGRSPTKIKQNGSVIESMIIFDYL